MRVAFDVKDRLLQFALHGVDGFEGVVLEDFLADFIPEIFLRIEFWCIGRQEQQRDVVGNREAAASMVGGAVENQQDILPGKSSRQDIDEALKACRIRCRHDQIDAGTVLRRNRAIQIDVFANELGGHLRPDAARRPARSRPVDPAETRFIGEHDPQPTAALGGRPPNLPYRAWKAAFLKSC